MPKKKTKTPEELLAARKTAQEDYRHRVRRFTFQFSLHDTEALEWFEQQSDKGAYLKRLILEDKMRDT